MALPVKSVGDILVVSVHDEEEPIHFHIPSVTPSRYDIPGINAPSETFKTCMVSFPNSKPMRYAFKRTIDNHPYVLVKIVEPHTFIYGSEPQKLDEYNKPLAPDVQRIPVPVRMEQVANEIERQCGQMGLEAAQGAVTKELVLRLEAKSIDFMRRSVSDTNRLAKRSPMNITPQARRRAWRLHKMGLLTPLPLWADVNPEADSTNVLSMFNCINCGTQLRAGTVKCSTPGCGVIYNWKQAVDLGLIKPSEVPLSKRVEAGLEPAQAVQAGIQAAADTRESVPPLPGKDPLRQGEDEDDADQAFTSLNATDLPPVQPPTDEPDEEEEELEEEAVEQE
jgi:hypothetical protein